MDSLFNNPVTLLFWFAALVISISIHEFAHAYMADRLGDPTPGLQGRLTLNPLAHLDPLGTIMLLFFRFGWGKPVQFDPFNLRNPRRDSAIISLAGPVSNIALATVGSVLYQLLLNVRFVPSLPTALLILLAFAVGFLKQVIVLNVVLAVFNLVPIHPLDGFKIVGGILPKEYARQWAELEPYGMIFLLFMIFPIVSRTAPINAIIMPIINAILSLLLPTTPLI